VRAAIGRLHPHAEVRLLGLPDGQLSDNLPTLSTVIADLAAGCSHVITPWRGDRHPDHEACANAATEAIAGLRQPPELWQYPIWAWHWADPDSPDIPWADMQCVVLSNADRLAKLAAIRMHVSQHLPLSDKAGDEAILSPATLAYFTRDYETFVVEPLPHRPRRPPTSTLFISARTIRGGCSAGSTSSASVIFSWRAFPALDFAVPSNPAVPWDYSPRRSPSVAIR
jgi:LmbE family N-acetylglucosaminyl deacetylase